MEPSSSENEDSSKTYASTYSSDHGPIWNYSIPDQCMDKLDITTPIKYSQTIGLSEHVLDIVPRTERYLRERRIPELIHFLLTKLLADSPDNPVEHIVKILDACMLNRVGLGSIPVIYEERFVIKSVH